MFNTIIVQPLINLLVIFYSAFGDFGLAVIAITILVRAMIWPLFAKSLHSQKALKAIQPEIEKLNKKYKDDPKAKQKALTELYKEKEVNPFSSCLPTLLQLPILIGLYWVFVKFGNPEFVKLSGSPQSITSELYNFVKNLPFVQSALSQGTIDTTFLGIVDLAKPSHVLAILAGVSQLVQTKFIAPKEPEQGAQQMMTKTMYLFPILTVVISWNLPSALPLYWGVSTSIAAFQQYLIMHKEVSLFEHIGINKLKEKVTSKKKK